MAKIVSDPEILALQEIEDVLAKLADDEGKQRVLEYAVRRHMRSPFMFTPPANHANSIQRCNAVPLSPAKGGE